MFILTVAPIARGIPHGHLTYFTKEEPPLGSLIMVPVRTREVPALVLSVTEAADSKSSLKNSEYSIRKIARIKPRIVWSGDFLRAAEKTADHHAQDLGETLLALTPKTILDQFIAGTHTGIHPNTPPTTHKTSIFAAQATTKVRMSMYQRLVREAFARNQSVFICIPQELDAERISEELSRGIEDYVFTFTSSIAKKKLLTNWDRVLHEEHPVLVVGTPQYLSVPRLFDTIILDEEHARAWKTLTPPLLDLRVFVEAYAKETRAMLIIGAPILRPETHRRIEEREIYPHERIATHAHKEILERELRTAIINPKQEERDYRERMGQRVFRLLGLPLEGLMRDAISNRESVLLLSARKGLSPLIRCGDCGTVVCCPECKTPLVLHEQKGKGRIFSCHACGYIRAQSDNTFEKCSSCESWRLESLGIGTERIEQEIDALFPGTKTMLFDGDVIKTPAQAKKAVAAFTQATDSRTPCIMIATPMIIPYLKKVDQTIVISLDSLFAIPDIRMQERIFGMLLALREKTERSLIVQSRLDDTSVFADALSGNLSSFMEQELALRKTFNYPPYGTIIKITIREKKEQCLAETEHVQEFFKAYNPIIPPTMSRDPKGLYKMHALIKLPLGVWGSKDDGARELLKKLRVLPRHMSIEINPDNLL